IPPLRLGDEDRLEADAHLDRHRVGGRGHGWGCSMSAGGRGSLSADLSAGLARGGDGWRRLAGRALRPGRAGLLDAVTRRWAAPHGVLRRRGKFATTISTD